MRVLITGGTGLIGEVTTAALLHRGEQVRVLARHASTKEAQWPAGVEAVDGSMTDDEAALERAVQGCEVVVHLASLARLVSGEPGFEEVNIEGTRKLLAACERAGVRRVVYISSLGAERGQSPYHQSKFAAEGLVRGFSRQWTILRPANVYGPGDEVISLLLRMVRTLPVVPTVDGGKQPFQPIWVEDVAQAIARSIDQADVVGRALDLAGPDLTSMDDVIDRLGNLTGRHPARVSVPGFLAVLGARAGTLLGLDLPLDPGQLTMLEEGNVLPPGAPDAVREVFHLTPTSLDEGLAKLAQTLPEQLDGVGGLQRRHVSARIEGSALSPEALFARFCQRFSALTPWHVEVGVEPGAAELRDGGTLTLHLPLRGNVQVRTM
ncbi:MAG: NAD-dependent epimerase/dehydratase family protein, partial [Myxococcales bacterium]